VNAPLLHPLTQVDRVPLPRAAWYLGCASHLLQDKPVGIRLFSEPIVLWRDGEGRAQAVYDRCPHRGVALSLGQVEDGAIACAYHGWRFGGDGGCRLIPSLTDDRAVPPGARLRSYPCEEQDSQIWVWTGEEEPTEPPRPIPGFAETCWLQGAVDLACEPILPIENNLDICHASFTHPGQHPQWFMAQAMGLQERAHRLRQDAAGMTVDAGPVTLRFDLPDRVTVAMEAPRPFCLVLHHVPTAPGRCRQHWLMASGAASEERPHEVRWVEAEPEILAQDRVVMESAQLAYAGEGGGFEISVAADATGLMARRLLRLAAAGTPIEPAPERVIRART
jgi:phenylpropionate dioxygenase-like ring-hydroxylating dioxygenase large terminal subunit